MNGLTSERFARSIENARLASKSFQFLFIAILCSACSTAYEDTATQSWELMAESRADEALALYEEKVTSEKEALLRLMDEGILLRSAGRYRESNDKLLEAADIIEDSGYLSLGEQGITLLSNEKQTVYQGEDFERVLVHVYLALNFIKIENWSAALVEARKVNEVLLRLINDGTRPYKQNAFARYLSAMIYEKGGEFNSAYIDYKKTFEIEPQLVESFEVLALDLLVNAMRLGFEQDLERYREDFGEELFQEAQKIHQGDYGALVLLFESGKSPRKYSSRERHKTTGKSGNIVDVVLPVAHYKERETRNRRAKLIVGKKVAETHTLSDIESTAIRHLKDRMGRAIGKALLTAATKAGIAVGVAKATNSDELGLLAGLALFAASEADTRSWLLLPEKLQVAKLFLPEGHYDAEVQIINAYGAVADSRNYERIRIQSRDPSFIQLRSFR